VPALSVTDNFFELGGDSLQAVRLVSILRREVGVEMRVSALFSSPTIRSLAQRLRDSTESAGGGGDRSVVVPIRRGGTAVPLIFAHPIGGDVLCYSQLGKKLGEDQPFYALQSRDSRGDEPSLEEMVKDYARAIIRDVPGSRYRLGGWSMGGVLAIELARELKSLGCSVDFVVAIDVLGAPRDVRQPLTRNKMLSWLGKDLAGLTGRSWAPGESVEGALDSLPELFESLRSHEIIPEDIDRIEFEALFARFEINIRALYGHRPKQFDGPVYFLQAVSGAGIETAEDWRSLCLGRFEKIPVPGNHYTVLGSTNVDAVASVIQRISVTEVRELGR
ncbi:MAG: hypothetical protein QOE58_2305, partial [Actinomycetota bacterium]|nr:hypothetical protein [Actinomycetota bacterium]